MSNALLILFLLNLATVPFLLRWVHLVRRYSRDARWAAAYAVDLGDQLQTATNELKMVTAGVMSATTIGRCAYPMTLGELATISCALAPRHHGDHAYAATDLRTYGYAPPF
jgi:hypothetical protein